MLLLPPMLPGTRIVGFGFICIALLLPWVISPVSTRLQILTYSLLGLGSLISGVGLVGAALRGGWTCWRSAQVRRAEDPILFWLLILTMAGASMGLTAFSAIRLWLMITRWLD